jgi:RimJ/RimL family protein N-acetyltransferase
MPIRLATISDIPELARVQIASWRAAYVDVLPASVLGSLMQHEFEGYWQRGMIKPGRVNWACLVDDNIIGFAAAGPSRNEDSPPPLVGELYGLYLLPEHWGSGKGRALWEAVRSHLFASGFREVIIWVFEENHRARHFYEHIGFRLDPGQRKMLALRGVERPELRYRQSLGDSATR